MYKFTHNIDPNRVFCGYNLKYPQNKQRDLDFFARTDLKTFIDLEDKDNAIDLDNGKKAVSIEVIKKGQRRCLLAFTGTLPVIFWAFTCSLMTLTPWGWKLSFWKNINSIDSMIERNVIIPLVIIMPIVALVFFIIFLYKLLMNIY